MSDGTERARHMTDNQPGWARAKLSTREEALAELRAIRDRLNAMSLECGGVWHTVFPLEDACPLCGATESAE